MGTALAILASIAMTVGLTVWQEIQNKQADDNVNASDINNALNKMFKEARTKGNATLSKLSSQLNAVNNADITGSSVYQRLVRNARQDLANRYEKAVDDNTEFETQAANIQNAASAVSYESNASKLYGSAKTRLDNLKNNAKELSNKYEITLKEDNK